MFTEILYNGHCFTDTQLIQKTSLWTMQKFNFKWELMDPFRGDHFDTHILET